MFLISSTILLLFILLSTIASYIFYIIERYSYFLFNENSIFYGFLTSMGDEEFNSFLNNFIITLTFWGSFIISCGAFMLFLQKIMTKDDLNINNRVSFKFKMPKNAIVLMIAGLAIGYFFIVISIGFDALISLFGIEKRVFDSIAFPQTAAGIIMYFIAVVISPSILEEFLCRYLILNALRKYGDGLAITVSSVFFGLLHGRTNAFFFATAIGFFLAYIAIQTKSIWFPIILHAVVNSMSMFWQFFAELSERHNFEWLFVLIFQFYITLVFGITLIYIIRLIRSRYDLSLKRRRDYIHISRGRKTVFFFNIATVIFIILAIWRSTAEYYISGAYLS